MSCSPARQHPDPVEFSKATQNAQRANFLLRMTSAGAELLGLTIAYIMTCIAGALLRRRTARIAPWDICWLELCLSAPAHLSREHRHSSMATSKTPVHKGTLPRTGR